MSSTRQRVRAPGVGSCSPTLLAGLLIEARACLRAFGLACPSVAQILRATGAGSSRAYERRREICGALRAVDRPSGRPPVPDGASAEVRVTRRVLDYLLANPGSVTARGARRFYSADFQTFIRDLRRAYPRLSLIAFARAARVRPSTLRAWLRAPAHRHEPSRPGAPIATALHQAAHPAASLVAMRATTAPDAAAPPSGARERSPEAVLIEAWRGWRGSLSGFCRYARSALGLPWRRTAIARLLADAGLRWPRPRPGRRPDARAPRGSFCSFFPGAVWTSDGSAIQVSVDGRRHTFNLQLVVDTDSGAVVGTSIRDHEDGAAVREAFDGAVRTTGEAPLSLLLDRNPCNRGLEVRALGRRTTVVYAGKHRPQSKGHVEGAFGLFAQTMPALELRLERDPRGPGAPIDTRALAGQVLALIVQAWARTWNYRPRRTRGHRTRVELYRARRPDLAQRRVARAAIRRRALARPDRRRRPGRDLGLRPFVRAELERLGIADPTGYVATVLAARPSHAVLAGLAIYRGKRGAGTLPDDAGGRYLLGIVERLTREGEAIAIGDALWQVRTGARAHVAATLDAMEADARAADRAGGARAALDAAVDRALDSDGDCDRRLWLAVAGRIIRAAQVGPPRALYRRASRRIVASRRRSSRERLDALRLLAAESVPIAP